MSSNFLWKTTEKIRFKNKFDVFYNIAPEVYNRDMIKFTLQPILENAFEANLWF